MDLSDRRTNLLLKREVFTLAMETSDACPGIPLSSYILQVEDLAAMEISGQKEVLTEHLHSKQGCKNFNRCRPVIHLRRLLLLLLLLLRSRARHPQRDDGSAAMVGAPSRRAAAVGRRG